MFAGAEAEAQAGPTWSKKSDTILKLCNLFWTCAIFKGRRADRVQSRRVRSSKAGGPIAFKAGEVARSFGVQQVKVSAL